LKHKTIFVYDNHVTDRKRVTSSNA